MLALFIPGKNNIPELLFTRRSADLRSHAGQVGFPGGRREESDESPEATALRESYEEIALPSDRVTCLGSLPSLKALDGKLVLPIVAYADITLNELRPNPEEVAEIFSIPWTELSVEKNSKVRFNIFGNWRETPYYEARGQHIWGLTAIMVQSMALKDS